MKRYNACAFAIFLILAGCCLCGIQVRADSDTKVVVEQENASSGYGAYIIWTTYIGADGYHIYTSKDGKTSWETESYYDNNFYMTSVKTMYVKVVPYVTKKVEGSWTKSSGWEYEDVEVTSAASDPVKIIAAPGMVEESSIRQTKATTKSATVTWGAVADATAYRIYDRRGKFLMQTSATKATIKISAGQSKDFEICAIRQNGSFTAKGDRTTFSAMAAPGKVEYLADASEGTVGWSLPLTATSFYAARTVACIKWKKNQNDDYTPDGYKVMIYSVDGKKKLKTMTVKGTSNPYVTFDLKAVRNKGCKVRVAGYVEMNGKTFYGQWTEKTVIPQAQVSFKVLNKKSVKLSWKKVTNAISYTIYVCDDISGPDPEFYKLKTVGKNVTSYTIKNILKKGRNTGICVIPTVKIKGKTYTAGQTWYRAVTYGQTW